jgi:hypothetical protein
MDQDTRCGRDEIENINIVVIFALVSAFFSFKNQVLVGG